MRRAVGLDFGTTNSAIAVADADGAARLAAFEADGGMTTTFRSILYFFHPKDEAAEGRRVVAGPAAIPASRDADPRGRFIQSMKSFLTSRLFEQTQLFNRVYRLEDLIAIIVRDLRAAALQQFGGLGGAVVVGRPVRFAGASNDDDAALALERLQAAVRQAGFEQVAFEYEPVAAAAYYETQLDHDELVLIADFGGGTSDFSLLRLGPSMRRAPGAEDRILGAAGIPVGGNDFDSRFIRHLVAPALGADSEYRAFSGNLLPMPKDLYAELERWDKLSFLKTRQTLAMLQAIRAQSLEPEKIDGLLHVIDEDLGYPLYQSVESAKLALSAQEASAFTFDEPPVAIAQEVRRATFETWIEPYLRQMSDCVDGLLAQCGAQPRDVDSVFMTGGSSFAPAVQQVFEQKFSSDRLRRGGELTSVATGLALCAHERASCGSL